jgi:hypothetical protein
MPADARERFFHALELADGGFELAAHARIRAGGAGREFRVTHRRGRQGNRAARREALHEHAPSLPGHFTPADDPLQRHEHIRAPVRSVLENRVQGHVPTADVDPGSIRGHEKAGDAQILSFAQQVIRVVQAYREAQQCRYWAEGDIAFFPGHAHAQHFLALPWAPAYDAAVRDRRGIRTRVGIGEAKAGNLQPLGEARQIVIALLIRAVMK